MWTVKEKVPKKTIYMWIGSNLGISHLYSVNIRKRPEIPVIIILFVSILYSHYYKIKASKVIVIIFFRRQDFEIMRDMC